MKTNIEKQYKDITLRLIQLEDATRYYEENFTIVDEELNFFTGSDEVFSKEQIVEFVEMSVSNDKHYLFVMVNSRGNIIGETVINNFNNGSANFRIAIFHKKNRDLGYGSWAVKETCEYAREVLHLKRLTLSVLAVNARAMHMYEKYGFKKVNKSINSICIEQKLYDEWEMESIF